MTYNDVVETFDKALRITWMTMLGGLLAIVVAAVLAGYVGAVINYKLAPAIEDLPSEPSARTIVVRGIDSNAPRIVISDMLGPNGRPLPMLPAKPVPHSARPAETQPAIVTPPASSPPPDHGEPAVATPPAPAPARKAVGPADVPHISLPTRITQAVADAWQAMAAKLPPLPVTVGLMALAFVILVFRNGIEAVALAAARVGDLWQALLNRRDQNRRERERRSYRRISEKEFRADMERQNRRIADCVYRSDVLYGIADRLEVSWLNIPFVIRHLRRRAASYIDSAERWQEETDRLERLWADIEQDRRAAKDVEAGERVRMLLRLLGSKVEAAAARALAELNKIGNAFDWAGLVPEALPAEARAKMEKLLRLLAGASTVSEAQTAYGRILALLKSHGVAWREAAA